MTLYFVINGEAVAWRGEPIQGIVYPQDIERVWTADELLAVGLRAAEPPPPVPEGKILTGVHVELVNGTIKTINDVVDAPPPTIDELYPPLEKWRFWAIINMPGSIGEVNLRAAINKNPDPVFKAIAMARLNDPPGGYYVRSDAMFNNTLLMQELNVTPDIINNLWQQGLGLSL